MPCAAHSAPRAGQAATVTAGEPAPVRVWNREVVVLRADLGPLTSTQRARQIEDRVRALPHRLLDSAILVTEVRLGDLVGRTLSIDGRALVTLVEEDLDPGQGEDLPALVERTRLRLTEALAARRDQRDVGLILRGIGLAAAATLVLAAVLWLLAFLRGDLIKRIRRRAARSERLRVREIDLRPYVADALERLVRIVVLLAILFALYAWAEFSLGCFPYTQPWGAALAQELAGVVGWTLRGIAGAVPDLLIVGIVFLVTRGVARTITMIVTRMERRAERVEGVAPETVRATRRLAVVLVWIFGVVLAYPHLPGAGSDAFRGVSVLLGVMVSLGSAGLVNQVMSGFVVLYSRSVRSGEVVRIGDVEGQVTDLGLLSTRVLKPSGEVVSIPNAVVITQPTTNYSREAGAGRAVVPVRLTIGYDTPWRQVRALLLLAAQRTEGVVDDPAPRVSQESLGDHYVSYVLVVQVEDGKQRAAVVSRLNAAIQDAFNEYGVQIMSPHFVGQPEQPVVVARGAEEPEPAPRFRFAKEAPPASFDPVQKAAEERAQRAAEEAAKAERARLREEREKQEEVLHEDAGAEPRPDEEETGEEDPPHARGT